MTNDKDPMRHVVLHTSRAEHWRHVVEIVALVIAAAWGFYVFVYQERIKPALEQPNLDFAVDVEHTALRNGKELIAVTPSWKNRGSVAAQIDGFVLNVSGISYTTRDIAAWHSDVPKVLSKDDVVNEFSRGMPGASTPLFTIFVRWKPLGGATSSIRQRGDTITPTRTFVIPQGRFDAVRVTDSWCGRRADDQRIISYDPVRLADGTYDVLALPRAEKRHRDLVFCQQLATGIERGI